ncbi:hypothetical protein SanaruYs_31690 [Chryseotalea sanaruensis]|uniref:PKD domain-containing protein n=2 Tax=Chryseotalea sanaruensis TaxID=2482724 RepID=A0A401UDH3_9BACT|nr:hypothetical protein SanaruYs_31690 [Chryseotalea sanaruensis]
MLHTTYATEKPGLKFIENKNQWDEDLFYRAKINGGFLSLSKNGFAFNFVNYQQINEQHHQRKLSQLAESGHVSVQETCIDAWNTTLSFLGTCSVKPIASGRSAEYYNYFLGSDAKRWASEAYAYESVLYPEFYEGIDLRIYSSGPNAKYDWIVKAGEDPSKIQWQYKGFDSLYIQAGSVYATTTIADVIERKPYAYQDKNGYRFEIPVDFVLEDGVLRYQFPDGYDACFDLVIDPLLIFSTYSGATADNWGSTATPGERGTLYSSGVVRDTYGQNLTGKLSKTEGSFQMNNAGGYDIAIFKYDSTGSQLLFATYLGGASSDSPHSLLVNNNDELIVLGTTSSLNFPTSENAFIKNFQGGNNINPTTIEYPNGSDITISRISSDGSVLLSSTYVGGFENDGLNAREGSLLKNYGDDQRGDIIVDEFDNVYVASVTSSFLFPFLNSVNTAYQGGISDAILFKMNADLSVLEWSTSIGGSSSDAAYSIKFDTDKNLIVAGGTSSNDFETTVGAYQENIGGNVDGWIAKFDNSGSTLLAATYTGTNSYDQIYFVDLDVEDNIYVYGQTTGNFPVTAGVFSVPNSGQFIQKFSSDLSSLEYSTVFGSGTPIPNISPTAFLVNDCNNIYVAGWGGGINASQGFWTGNTRNLPITPDALQTTTTGNDFYFLVLTADASEVLYGTYLGGTQTLTHVDGGTSRFDKGGVVYHAVCASCGGGADDFRTTPNAWSRLNNSQNCNNAAFKFDLSSLTARSQTNNEARNLPGFNRLCIPDGIIFQNFSTGGEIFEWDLGNGETRVLTDTSSFTYFYKSPGTYVVTLTAIDQGTCKVQDVATKTILVAIAQSAVQDDDAICEGDNYQLQASGAAQYTWVSKDGKEAFNTQNPNINPTQSTSYYVTLQEVSGCIRKDTVNIEVVPSIVPEFKLQRTANCLDRPGIEVINPQADSIDYTFTFSFGDGQQSDLPEVQHSFESDSLYNIKLIAQRDFCVFEQEEVVDIRSVFMPNVITPKDQDGKNDVFMIWYGKAGDTPADAGLRTSVVIYNRWGTIVYENTNYQYDWSGEDLVSGVYFYEVTIEGYATCKDWLHLIK